MSDFTLTPAQLEIVKARTRAECEAQGIPLKVDDPATLARIARLVAGMDADRCARARSASPAGGTRGATSQVAS